MSEMKAFATGSMRSKDADNEAYHLAPPEGLRRLAAAMEEGRRKYKLHNWRLGQPWGEVANHALRHIYLWLERDETEDHLGHALANLAFLCQYEKEHNELDDRYREPVVPRAGDGETLSAWLRVSQDPLSGTIVGSLTPGHPDYLGDGWQ